MENRLSLYLEEAEIHKNKIKKALNKLPINLTVNDIKKYEEALDMLAFRFSRLQGILGEKIFREYLEYNLIDTKDKSFLDILKLIEKEGIVDIDTWSSFRKVRNFIFHEYPLSDEEKVEVINFLIKNAYKLIEIEEKIYDKINTKRD